LQTRDRVPTAPFARVAQEWLGKQEESGNPLGLLADELKTDRERLRKIVTGKQEFMGFDQAEKLLFVCDGTWDDSPELFSIYEDFCFDWLDRVRPTTRVAA